MKYYLSKMHYTILIIGIIIASSVLFSCKSASKKMDKDIISQALYYKSFGGQGRSRMLNFEILLSQNIERENSEFWLLFKSSKIKLRKYSENGIYTLKGQYTEHKKRRDEPWLKEGTIFSEIPFSKLNIQIESQGKTKTIPVNNIKSKEAVYYP